MQYQSIAKKLQETLPADVAILNPAILLADSSMQFSIDKMGLPRSKQQAALEKVCSGLGRVINDFSEALLLEPTDKKI